MERSVGMTEEEVQNSVGKHEHAASGRSYTLYALAEEDGGKFCRENMLQEQP